MANLLRTEWYKLWHSWYFWGIGIFTFLLSSILLLDSKGKTSNLVMTSLYAPFLEGQAICRYCTRFNETLQRKRNSPKSTPKPNTKRRNYANEYSPTQVTGRRRQLWKIFSAHRGETLIKSNGNRKNMTVKRRPGNGMWFPPQPAAVH